MAQSTCVPPNRCKVLNKLALARSAIVVQTFTVRSDLKETFKSVSNKALPVFVDPYPNPAAIKGYHLQGCDGGSLPAARSLPRLWRFNRHVQKSSQSDEPGSPPLSGTISYGLCDTLTANLRVI